jgi:hypothetical protein
MVVIYIEMNTHDETFWFENPFKGHHITLSSCSFTNDIVCNLSSEGTISVGGKIWLHIPRGNYSGESLKHLFENAEYNSDSNSIVSGVLGKPSRIIVSNGKAKIYATQKLTINESLRKLLNIKDGTPYLAKDNNYELNIIQPPRNILIHCNLIESREVTFNGKYQHLLSVINIGDCGDKVRHLDNGIRSPMKDTDSINNVRLRITDVNGEAVTYGAYPMTIAIKIS